MIKELLSSPSRVSDARHQDSKEASSTMPLRSYDTISDVPDRRSPQVEGKTAEHRPQLPTHCLEDFRRVGDRLGLP